MSSGKRAGFVVGLALTVLMVFGGGLSTARADTLYVNGATGNDAWDGRCETWDGAACGPKATIQAGIDAAVAGDEVVIADGTYTGTGNKNLDFLGKAITVRSASGDPALCVIDCEDDGRGFFFHSGEDTGSIVQGLTITNGHVDGNGLGGAGVYCYASSPILTNCIICDNTAYNGSGGGVLCVEFSSPTLINCTIRGNTADSGGGIFCNSFSSPALSNCTIRGNTASITGGAAMDYYLGCYPTLTNCTILGNASTDSGGGLGCTPGCSSQLVNCILWANTPQQISPCTNEDSPRLRYCDVQGGWSGTGNIDANPGFAITGDCHLTGSSPCIDAGANAPAGGLPDIDADGNPRLLDGDGDGSAVADIGAYEFNLTQPAIATAPEVLQFFMPVGGTNPSAQRLSLANGGGGVLQWTLSGAPPWLTAVPGGGQLAGGASVNLTLSVDGTGFPHGVYRASLKIVDSQAPNSPRTVFAALHIGGVTLHVPTGYATIQAAIDAAVHSDIVEVADGVYTGVGNKDLHFRGKAITVRSASGDPMACVLDCQGDGRGLYFHGGEGPSTVVEGITIANGRVSGGRGGGILCSGSSPTLANCTITENSSADGGGVYCSHSDPVITSCRISNNVAYGDSGGLYAYGDGGGLYCGASSPTVVNCTIGTNRANYEGGAVYCVGSSPSLANCAIMANTAGSNGGCYLGQDGNAAFTNCTVVGNAVDSTGAALRGHSGNHTSVTNCILWANKPRAISGQGFSLRYCDVQGGWSGVGNINVDPQCAFPGDGHLMPGSPCIDAATNSPAGGLPTCDLDGSARPLDGDGNGVAIADMGAYEFNPAAPTIALHYDAFEFHGAEGGDNPFSQSLSLQNSGVGTLNWEIVGQPAWLTVLPSGGTTTTEEDTVVLGVDSSGLLQGTHRALLKVIAPDAVNSPRDVTVTLYLTGTHHVPSEHPTIQAAINAAINGDVVEIANGRYAGDGNKNLDFHRKAITVRSASGDPALCIIDCEGDGRGFYFHAGEGPGSSVVGLTVTNGYVDSSSPGGYDGGGIQCRDKSGPTLTNLTIRANHADRGGGGLSCSGSSPTLTNCTVIGNDAGGGGGGVYCGYGGVLTLTGCTIVENSVAAPHGVGGGIQIDLLNSTVLTNCTVGRNVAGLSGGGVHCSIPRSVTLANCILWDDAPEEIYGAPASAVVTYCSVQGGWPGVGNIDADPLFVDPDGPDNDPNTWADNDYHLSPGSPCINAGDPDLVADPNAVDMDGEPRVQQCRVDIGADETPYFVADCNENGVADTCDVLEPGADVNGDRIPDNCQIGDLNCDGVVDFGDINPFVDVLMGLERYAAKYPGCDYMFADINGDGLVDFGDINPLIDLLMGR